MNTEAIEATRTAMQKLEWELNVWYPAELSNTTNARRIASLKRNRAVDEKALSRLVTEYCALLQEA